MHSGTCSKFCTDTAGFISFCNLAGEVIDVLVRRQGTANPMEVRVAIIGNVDSGKSTMVGVLTRSMLDDGRGLARSKVFKHNHEEATGRTSSIGQHNLCVCLLPTFPSKIVHCDISTF